VAKVVIDGVVQGAQPNELLIDLINRTVPAARFPTSAITPQLGPVQTGDTCMDATCAH
jgi:hypothetical protein